MSEPLIVAVGDHRSKGLFRNGLWQDDVRAPIGKCRTDSGKLRSVVGKGVALPAFVGGDHRFGALEGQRLDVQVVLVGKVLQVQLGRGALGHAHGGALQLQGAGDSQALVDHEPLSVVEHRLGVVSPLGVARSRPGNRPDQHVDLAGLDCRAAFGGGDQTNLDLAGVTQHSGGEGSAEVDVKADVVALAIQKPVAGHVVAAGAYDAAALLHRV